MLPWSSVRGKCFMELKNLISDGEKVQIYESDGKCIKVFKDENEPKSVVMYEALAHARVEETGLARIPALQSVEQINGKWCMIYDFVEGRTLDELIRENPAMKLDFLGRMADLHLEVNSLSCVKMSSQLDYFKRSVQGLDMIDDVKKHELLTLLGKLPTQKKLCHGEFTTDNIIVGDNGEMYVVDWLRAKQGTPAADVAKTYLDFCLRHRTESAEQYLKIYCKKAGIEPNAVYDWLPIVAASQLKFRLPAERELLLTWIDVVDY